MQIHRSPSFPPRDIPPNEIIWWIPFFFAFFSQIHSLATGRLSFLRNTIMKFHISSAASFSVLAVTTAVVAVVVDATNQLNGAYTNLFTEQDEEYTKYGCANPNANPMAACFCGFLNDRVDSTSLSTAELSQQAATTCVNGNAGGFPCANVDLQAHIPLSTFGSTEANDIWGWTDTTSGREFAIIGLRDGTGFVEITTPSSPIYLGKLPTHTFNSSWRDIKVYNDHAFIVSEASSHGMQVFDLSTLLTVATPQTFSETAYYNDGGAVGSAHNIAINEDSGLAYIVGGSTGCAGGLHVVDISTPTNPTKVGCRGSDGYVHDTHCVIYNGPDTTYTGREICFGCNEDTVTIVDVTNNVQLSKITYNQEGTQITLHSPHDFGSILSANIGPPSCTFAPLTGYTHQGWLSPDQKYFVFGDETDETSFRINTKTLVLDVQDLNNPFLAGTYLGPTAAIDHNLYIIGDIAYLANYRAGLRILKINDFATANLSEIGFFDIYPSSDTANYNGAWSVYPYYASGNVVVSGIEQGLFVLTPDTLAGPICNNNGSCDPGENCNNCSNDCGSKTSGNPNSHYCCDGYIEPDCGNSNCGCVDPAPTPVAAPSDPAPTPVAAPSAPTPVAAPSSPTPCGGNRASCTVDADCCSNSCKGGSCKGGRLLRRAGGDESSFEKDVMMI